METTPSMERFDSGYAEGSPPWVIGEPQPAIVELERSGVISGAVLDPGCGAGEHTILLASLGYDVLGVDFAPNAVEQAKRNATRQGVSARFDRADALDLDASLPGDGPRFDTVVDSALFHVFDDTDRTKYVRSLHAVTKPGGVVHVLALSDREEGFGPRIGEAVIREAFTDGWTITALDASAYRGIADAEAAKEIGVDEGPVDLVAWLAAIRRD